MFKKGLISLLILSIFSGCSQLSDEKHDYKYSIKEYAIEVGKYYGDSSPDIVDINKTITEKDHAPMFLIKLEGNFQKEGKKARYISFSSLTNDYKVWAIVASNSKDMIDQVWEETDITESIN